ncbi:MAG: HEAT repeat domain-containing protein [Synechococcales bacterium]|nr:HEAT repeat domain-containing protein [Synechococcales bacterium]
MNQIIGILAAIAAVLAGFGMVLFGKPKGDRDTTSETTEQVIPTDGGRSPEPPTIPQPTIPQPTPVTDPQLDLQPITELPAPEESTAPEEIAPVPSEPIAIPPIAESPIADPWVEESEGSITLDWVSNVEADAELDEAAIELDLDDATQAVEGVESEAIDETPAEPPVDETERLMARAAAARYQSSAPGIAVATTSAASKFQAGNLPSSPASGSTQSGLTIAEAPFTILQDPKRPPSTELQDLSQQILEWGNTKQLSLVPKLLPYANHSDSNIRRYTALALGQIALPHTVKPEIEKVIPALGKLSQDSNADVRSMAMKALSGIQSPAVLPYLEKGLLSASGAVKEAANSAIQKLKLQYGTQPSSTDFPPSLQKKG